MLKNIFFTGTILLLIISCSIVNPHSGAKHNFFAISFKRESPYAINCVEIKKRCDTSFYTADTSIEKVISERMSQLKVSSTRFSDVRVKFIPSNKVFGKELCVDIAGKIQFGGVAYEKDTIILNKLLSYLPKSYL